MDSFDNRIQEMQNEIVEMKRNIHLMKSNNNSTLNHIKCSINNLSSSNIKCINNKSKTSLNTPINTNGNNVCTNANTSFRMKHNNNKENTFRIQSKPHKQRINSEVFKKCLQRMQPIYSERQRVVYNNNNNISQYQANQHLISHLKRCNSSFLVNHKLPMHKQNSARNIYENKIDNEYDNVEHTNDKYKHIVNKFIHILQSQFTIPSHTITEDTLINDINTYIDSNASNTYMLSQLKLLYNNYHNLDENEYVDNTTLYKWLIMDNNENNINEYKQYKDYCNSIITKYKLNNFHEMKMLINDNLNQQSKNEQFLKGMKQILCEEYKSTHKPIIKYNHNNNHYNYYNPHNK